MFAEVTAMVFAHNGVKAYLSTDFVSTPMVSLATVELKADLGVVITASHNPSDYNGYKLKGSYGGPLLPDDVEAVEALIPDTNTIDLESLDIGEFKDKGLIVEVDMEKSYCDHVEKNFDLDAIRNSGLTVAYDAMYGAGQNAVRKLLPDAMLMHCVVNPSFGGIPPEPIHKNLLEFSSREG